MRSLRLICISLMGAALLTGSASAQGFRGRGLFNSPVGLSMIPEVQTELKVDEAQKGRLATLGEAYRAEGQTLFQSLQGLSDADRQAKIDQFNAGYEKKLAEILKPEQLKRVNQIALQQAGARGLLRQDVATALELTQEQRAAIGAIAEQTQRARRELFQGAQGNFEQIQPKSQELTRQEEQQVNALLTDAQKTKLKELRGAPFQVPLRRPGAVT